MFLQNKNKVPQRYQEGPKKGQLKELTRSTSAESLDHFKLGKCYTVENGTNTFSELLENVFRPNVPIVVGHHENPEGKILKNISFLNGKSVPRRKSFSSTLAVIPYAEFMFS